jgi:hypothetical protein
MPLNSKCSVNDNVSVKLEKGIQSGYMMLSDFNMLERMTVEVFPNVSVAKAFGVDDKIIKVQVIRLFE